MNIITRPHMRHQERFNSLYTPEQRKAAQYATAERQEKQGKTVIKLHEGPPPRKVWPTNADMQERILGYFQATSQIPNVMTIPWEPMYPTMAYVVKGLPPEPELETQDGRGRLVEMRLIQGPAVQVAYE